MGNFELTYNRLKAKVDKRSIESFNQIWSVNDVEIVNLMPNIEDFTELNEDYEGSLDVFMAWDSVRAKFLMLEAERHMVRRVRMVYLLR